MRPVIALTFDDGTLKQYIVIRLFNFFGIKTTLFLTTGLICHPHTNEPMLVAYPNKIIKLYNLGNEIASHTHTHKDLVNLNFRELMIEILAPKVFIKKLIGVSSRGFAYPYGRYNNFIRNYVLMYYEYARIYNYRYVVDRNRINFGAIDALGIDAFKTITYLLTLILLGRKDLNNSLIILVFHSPTSLSEVLRQIVLLITLVLCKTICKARFVRLGDIL